MAEKRFFHSERWRVRVCTTASASPCCITETDQSLAIDFAVGLLIIVL